MALDPKEAHNTDQGIAACREFASRLAAFAGETYHRLRADQVPPSAAMTITAAAGVQFMRSMMGVVNNGGTSEN